MHWWTSEAPAPCIPGGPSQCSSGACQCAGAQGALAPWPGRPPFVLSCMKAIAVRPPLPLPFQKNNEVSDQWVEPWVVVDDSGKPVGAVLDGDAVVTFNFRADRMVEISKALEYKDFDHFDRKRWPQVCDLVGKGGGRRMTGAGPTAARAVVESRNGSPVSTQST